MVGRKSEERSVPLSAKATTPTPFDAFFEGNEGFVRPVRYGQSVPSCPTDVPKKGVHYLIQDLDGNFLALISGGSALDAFARIAEHEGVPKWMH